MNVWKIQQGAQTQTITHANCSDTGDTVIITALHWLCMWKQLACLCWCL